MSPEWRRLDAEIREKIEQSQTDGPTRLADLARSLGVELRAATLGPGISGEIRRVGGDQFRIRINRHDPRTRQRFTVAHELAHFLLHSAEIGDGIQDDKLYRSSLSDRREQEANRLAADILMHPESVARSYEEALEIGVGDVIMYVANDLDVSESAMEIRFKTLGYSIDA
jgi:hypothetical protein